MMNEVIQQ